MSAPPLSAPDSQFALEIWDHELNRIGWLPYRNVQGETFLNQSHQLRGEIPFRDYDWITPELFYPGKHELKLFDQINNVYQFGGPVWDATAGSGSGVISFSAQCPLSYMAKRRLDAGMILTGAQPADAIVFAVNYTASGGGIRNIPGFAPSKVTSNGQLVTMTYAVADKHMIGDVIVDLSSMADGTDYYTRQVNGSVATLFIYGGKLVSPKGLASWEYGGVLKNYSYQVNAQSISNDHMIIGSNGVIGQAVDAAAQTEYDALYQDVDTGSDLTSLASLNNAATTSVNKSRKALQIPSLVVKDLVPTVDFDLGDKRLITIDDSWVQYSDFIRIVGWQITVGSGDNITTTVYTNDISEVS